jgi:chemotaxis protein MotB
MDRTLAILTVVVLTPSMVLAGYVWKDRYDTAVRDAAAAQAQLASSLNREHTVHQALDDAQAQIKARDQKVSGLSTESHNLQAQLDETTAINAKLRTELEGLGKNVDLMLEEKGTLSKALDDTRARLDELRKAQAAVAARAALFQQFADKFRSLVDAGQLKIATRNGRLVLQLPNDVLFDSGQTALKPGGKDALLQVARALATVPDRTFQVAGHTDDVPIQNARFSSNWELSTARAVEVVKLLVAQGMNPKAISAAGYGEFDPIATNDTADDRAKNRRIEITLQPNLDELVSAPQMK